MKYLKDETEAQDAVMHIFEKLLRDLLTYEVQTFKFWVHTVVRNHCFALLASQKRTAEKSENYYLDSRESMEIEENSPLFGEGEATEAMLAHLPAAIEALNVEQRTCIELFYLNGKSYVEIAEETGYAMTKVKSHIQNGKRNLKIYLQKNIIEIIVLLFWYHL
jgi:RNA polymerase sigma-70 factor (ECF subfamily)